MSDYWIVLRRDGVKVWEVFETPEEATLYVLDLIKQGIVACIQKIDANSFVFPQVRRVFPTLTANELVSVQQHAAGNIFFLDMNTTGSNDE